MLKTDCKLYFLKVERFSFGNVKMAKLSERLLSMLPAAEGIVEIVRHTSTTNINMADSNEPLALLFPIVHCVKTNTFKGGRGGVRFLFRILNTLPHWKDVVLDIYNTAETIVSGTILKILVDLTH